MGIRSRTRDKNPYKKFRRYGAENVTKQVRQIQYVGPQPGPQTAFLQSSADIVIYGGMAGGGKTWAIEFEPLRHIVPTKDKPRGVEGFSAVIFRRTMPQIRNEGGLWDESVKLYPQFDGKPRETLTEWVFPHGQTVRFAGLQYEQDKQNWQGAQIPFIGFDELTHFCMAPETEVLTKAGWKQITDVVPGELVMSMAPDRTAEYVPATRVLEFPFDGGMVTLHQRNGLSYKVTPNHKMVVNTQAEDGHWKFERADQLDDKHTTIPRVGNWTGTRVETVPFDRPTGRGHGPNSNSVDSVQADDYLQLLGWYLSEGCAFERDGSPVVVIRQTKPDGQAKLRQMLDKLPWQWQEWAGGRFAICSRQLYDHLKPLGDTYTKRLPRWVLDLPTEQLQLFWDAFVDGDGSKYTSGAETVGLANEGLVDDLHEVVTLLGRIATKTYRQQTNQTGKLFDSWVLCVSRPGRHGTVVSPGQQQREYYKGSVWCLTVEPHHTFLARYNGRCFWTGNSEDQFFYLLSRNRSTCGIKPYIRATCNPDADSWVAEFIEWWIEQDETHPGYGLPIQSRVGQLRYFVRKTGTIYWGDSVQELTKYLPKEVLALGIKPESLIKSVTFIPASVHDNKVLLTANPEYLGNLLSLSLVERERLLGGNWKIRPSSGNIFNRAWWAGKIVPAVPTELKLVRYWDKAATDEEDNPRAAYTAGCLLGKDKRGNYYLINITDVQLSSLAREKVIQQTAIDDWRLYGDPDTTGGGIRIWVEQEPGSGGKESAEFSIRGLAGYHVKAERVTGSKVARAMPASAQVEVGNVYLLEGEWNKRFIDQAHAFPQGRLKDMVDAFTGAFNKLSKSKVMDAGSWPRTSR